MYSVGFSGFYAGPHAHIIDRYALADPLLSRLPATTGLVWRQGHFIRSLPRGYVETIWTGKNRIVSPDLTKLYNAIAMVTRADLFSTERLLESLALSFGMYDDLVTSAPVIEPFDVPKAVQLASAEDPDIVSFVGPEGSRPRMLIALTDWFLTKGEIGKAGAAWGTVQVMATEDDEVLRTGVALAQALQEREQGRLAMKVMDLCASLPGLGRDFHTQHAQMLFCQGIFVSAAEAARRGFSFDEPEIAPLLVIADVMRIERIPEAEVNYQAILQLDPEHKHARAELLAIRAERGNPTPE
jgi:hypothetical protein